ncbi:MAG: hypothetical protein ACOVRM_11480, partial [Planctomycetaceae bacterium]
MVFRWIGRPGWLKAGWGSWIGRFVVGRGGSPVMDFGCNAWTENGVMKGLVLAFVRGEEGFLLST